MLKCLTLLYMYMYTQTKPCSMVAQLSALTAILELARANQAKAFEPELFCVALETIICSRHTSGDLLAVIANSFAEYCDLRYYTCTQTSSHQRDLQEHSDFR